MTLCRSGGCHENGRHEAPSDSIMESIMESLANCVKMLLEEHIDTALDAILLRVAPRQASLRRKQVCGVDIRKLAIISTVSSHWTRALSELVTSASSDSMPATGAIRDAKRGVATMRDADVMLCEEVARVSFRVCITEAEIRRRGLRPTRKQLHYVLV